MHDYFRYDPLITGSKGLVFVGDDLLLYRRDTNTNNHPLYIDVPGGGSRDGESPFETFQREVKEEFDLHISAEDIVYARRYASESHRDELVYFAVAKLPESAARHIRLGNEGIEYFLMSLDEYMARDDAWTEFQGRARDYVDAAVNQE